MNSPAAVYQIGPSALTLLRKFDTDAWHDNLTAYLAESQAPVPDSLADQGPSPEPKCSDRNPMPFSSVRV